MLEHGSKGKCGLWILIHGLPSFLPTPGLTSTAKGQHAQVWAYKPAGSSSVRTTSEHPPQDHLSQGAHNSEIKNLGKKNLGRRLNRILEWVPGWMGRKIQDLQTQIPKGWSRRWVTGGKRALPSELYRPYALQCSPLKQCYPKCGPGPAASASRGKLLEMQTSPQKSWMRNSGDRAQESEFLQALLILRHAKVQTSLLWWCTGLSAAAAPCPLAQV